MPIKKIVYLFCISIFIQNYLSSNLPINSLDKIIHNYPEINYKKIHSELFFSLPSFTIAPSIPNEGTFKELFILTIPLGIVKGLHGYILFENKLIKELIWGELDHLHNLFPNATNIDQNNINKIFANVAVITQLDPKNYGHLILEILGRLAILEMGNVDYDYLYIPYEIRPFVKEILNLWGIDQNKIISPTDNNFTLQATQLICPSFNIRTNKGYRHGGNFHHPETLKYVRNKLLKSALEKNIPQNKFNKKIFISRGDTPTGRKIANENEIYEFLKLYGFTKYTLTELSVTEQIILFYNAEIVVSENGAGLTNIIFCNPNTHIIEIFQNFIAIDYWHAACTFNLKYTPINALLGEDANFYSDYHKDFYKFYSFDCQPIIPLEQLKKVIENL